MTSSGLPARPSALPVLDEGRLAGIVTTADLFRLTAGLEREL